jgi:hypothetical protein
MASVLGFLGSFGKEKLSGVQQSFMQKLVAWDPETASQAEIEEMIKELDKVTSEAGKARTDYEKEAAEAEAARKNYSKYLSAAELLEKQVADGDASKSGSLETLLAKLEEMRPDVEREEKEAIDAKEYFEEVKQLAEATAEKLKSAKSMLAAAHRDMKSAEIEQKRAADKAAQAEKLAGLRKDTGSLGVALEAMRKQASDTKAKAEADNMKAGLLGDMKKEDPNISEALKIVGGDAPKNASVAERLAALRK